MIILYCFDPGAASKLIFARSLHTSKDIPPIEKWIEVYEKESGRKLIRAVLGKTDLTVLQEDDKIVLPGEPLAAKGWVPK